MDRAGLVDAFLSQFNRDLAQLQRQISDEQQVSGGRDLLTDLKKRAHDASRSFLPAYNSKTLQASLTLVEKQLDDLVQATRPVKRFAFAQRNLKKRADMPTQSSVDAGRPPVEGDVADCAAPSTGNLVSNLDGQQLVLSRSQLQGQAWVLEHLTGCSVRLEGPAATLHLQGLQECRVTAAPVNTSVRVVVLCCPYVTVSGPAWQRG